MPPVERVFNSFSGWCQKRELLLLWIEEKSTYWEFNTEDLYQRFWLLISNCKEALPLEEAYGVGAEGGEIWPSANTQRLHPLPHQKKKITVVIWRICIQSPWGWSKVQIPECQYLPCKIKTNWINLPWDYDDGSLRIFGNIGYSGSHLPLLAYHFHAKQNASPR